MKNELMNTENRGTGGASGKPAKKDNSGLKILFTVFGILFVAVIVLAVVLIVKNAKDKFGTTEESIVEEEEETVKPEDLIQASVQSLGIMETATVYYTYVSTLAESKEVFGITIPGSSNSYVITADGKVTAGVNFSEAVVTYDEETEEYTVTLPKAKVTGSVIDNDSWQYFDERSDIFKPLSKEEIGDSYIDIAHDEESKAIDRGLLRDAERMAKTIVETLLKSDKNIGDNKINIVFGAK